MSRYRVAIADHAFAPIEIELGLFAEADAAVQYGDEALTEDAVIALARGCDAVLCDAAPITRRVLDALPTVRVVCEYGIGVDNVDVVAATELGIWVANVPGFCAEEVSDHAIAAVLALARRLVGLDRVVRSGGWGARAAGRIHRVRGQTVGLIGFGAIGRLTAAKAAALGMRVLAHSPNTTPERAAAHGAEAVSFEDVLRWSDYVCVHAPATSETRGLIDARALGMMKPTASLVNVSRGALVDEAALLEALHDGRIAGAALDVFAEEPPEPANQLLQLDNVLLTPHAAFYSEESLVDLQTCAARNAIAVLRGGQPNTPVNPEVGLRPR